MDRQLRGAAASVMFRGCHPRICPVCCPVACVRPGIRGQDRERRAHRERRSALAGSVHRRGPASDFRQDRRQLGVGGGSAQALLAAENADERRELLFPFLWGTVAKQGQIFGNRRRGSDAHVTNGKAFSYPGYNEMSTGYPNDAIDSNEYGPNPNATVFEWLNKFDELRGRVAIYGTWNIYDNIFNKSRSGLIMQTGWTLPPANGRRDAARCTAARTVFDHDAIRRGGCRQFLPASYPHWTTCAPDSRASCSSATVRPTIGRTRGATIWCSTVPTASIISSSSCGTPCSPCRATAGPPRSSSPPTMAAAAVSVQWKEHGVEQKGSENIWIAVIGPDTAGARRAHARGAGDPGANRGDAWRHSSARIIARRCRRRHRRSALCFGAAAPGKQIAYAPVRGRTPGLPAFVFILYS